MTIPGKDYTTDEGNRISGTSNQPDIAISSLHMYQKYGHKITPPLYQRLSSFWTGEIVPRVSSFSAASIVQVSKGKDPVQIY